MVPSRLSVTGFDEHSVFFQTVDGLDVFAEWQDLPIGRALSSDAVRAAARELHVIRTDAMRKGLAAIERALTVVTDAEDRRELQEAHESLSTADLIPRLAERDE